jgi:hypothetical protein
LTGALKSRISGLFLSKRSTYEQNKNPGLDQATINQRLLEEFEKMWSDLTTRLEIVPGKEILSQLNKHLQGRYKVTLSATAIIGAMPQEEVPEEIKNIIVELDYFRTLPI